MDWEDMEREAALDDKRKGTGGEIEDAGAKGGTGRGRRASSSSAPSKRRRR
jgi:hypothetical protein